MSASVFLYLMGCDRQHPCCKIGITKNLDSRVRSLQTGNPNTIWLVQAWQMNNRPYAEFAERLMHFVFSKFREQGEWFGVRPEYALPMMVRILEEVRDSGEAAGNVIEWRKAFEVEIESLSDDLGGEK